MLAYSTVSQLGYMFAAVGVGAYADGVFHLMTHAFFKACLFLGSGSVIHAMGGEQDMRKMGGLREQHADHVHDVSRRDARDLRHPAVRRLHVEGRDHLAGLRARSSSALGACCWLGAGITAFYMFRQVYMTFFGEFRGTHEQEHHLHESPPSMALVLVVLGVLSVVGGFVKIAGVHRRPSNPSRIFSIRSSARRRRAR